MPAGERGGGGNRVGKKMRWDGGLLLSAWDYTDQCRLEYGTSTCKRELGIIKCVEIDLRRQDILDIAWC